MDIGVENLYVDIKASTVNDLPALNNLLCCFL